MKEEDQATPDLVYIFEGLYAHRGFFTDTRMLRISFFNICLLACH